MTNDGKWSIKRINIVLLLLVIVITVAPFFFHPKGSEFGGADDQGPDLIQKEHPSYQVWFKPIWEPPSREIESLLFALQAGIGAGVIGYILGYLKAKRVYIRGELTQLPPERTTST
ncbi:MAG TPA: energy-coupling factor ABC transporter substrate-binding protein [Syntrophomonadaceae bacterium]|nr:energy-coupling factor ABC transporter substrate-binding protein [Syntrophomonadaceae bacterium]